MSNSRGDAVFYRCGYYILKQLRVKRSYSLDKILSTSAG